MKLTKQCYGCKESFRKTELVEYTGINAQTGHYYCPKCLKEKIDRERFAMKVCEIFGITAPGPIIWTQRKKIINEYGYSDQAIIDCLDYVYNVKKIKKLSETLYFVKPQMMAEARKWKKQQENKGLGLVAAIANNTTTEDKVSIKENLSNKKQINLDEYFDD